MYDIITIGSAILDILVKSKSFKLMPSTEFSGGLALCEAYGGKMIADQIELASGGGATNNAVSFARKGLKTAIIAEMGADAAGRIIQSELIKEGVDTDYLVVEEGEDTGVSVVLISGEDADRSVVSYRGASRMLTYKDVPFTDLKTKWLYISSLGGRIALLEKLVAWCSKNRVCVALNPGKEELKYRDRLLNFLPQVEVLLLNREEATLLTGVDYLDEKNYKSQNGIQGPKISVITAGRLGGKVCVGKELIFYTSKEVKRVSTLGAGDAFGSGLVAGLIYGKEIGTAIEWGKKNAVSVLQYLSAKQGLLRKSELGK